MAATATIRIDGTITSEPSGSELVGPLTLMGPVTFAPSCFRSIETCPPPMAGFRNDHVPATFQ